MADLSGCSITIRHKESLKRQVNNKKGCLFNEKFTKNSVTFRKNKPNSPNVQIFISCYLTSKYNVFIPLAEFQNKPNSNPIKAKSANNQSSIYPQGIIDNQLRGKPNQACPRMSQSGSQSRINSKARFSQGNYSLPDESKFLFLNFIFTICQNGTKIEAPENQNNTRGKYNFLLANMLNSLSQHYPLTGTSFAHLTSDKKVL